MALGGANPSDFSVAGEPSVFGCRSPQAAVSTISRQTISTSPLCVRCFIFSHPFFYRQYSIFPLSCQNSPCFLLSLLGAPRKNPRSIAEAGIFLYSCLQ